MLSPRWIFLCVYLLLAGCILPQATLAPVDTGHPPTEASPTGEPTPTTAPAPTLEPSPTGPPTVDFMVFFTDQNRYAVGTPPFEKAVPRQATLTRPLPELVLEAFFQGPTPAEKDQGLVLINSGFTGFSQLRIENSTAHVYLTGQCASLGATYTIAQPLIANLTQFPEILYVKIYDEQGVTENPEGGGNSIPWCLEP